MKRKYLFIDDIREPEYEFYNTMEIWVARNYKEATEWLSHIVFDLVSFDHDLGEEKTGYDIAKFIVENDIAILDGFKVHSANPVGRFNIEQLLTHYGYNFISNIWFLMKILL